MTFKDFEKRIIELELQASHDDPAPEPSPLGDWVASIPSDALLRVEMLMEALISDPDRQLTEVERSLLELCLLEDGDVDELLLWLSDWSTSDERKFLGGADLSMFFIWFGVDLHTLTPGELARLVALLQLVEANGLKPPPQRVLWGILGWVPGHVGRRVA